MLPSSVVIALLVAVNVYVLPTHIAEGKSYVVDVRIYVDKAGLAKWKQGSSAIISGKTDITEQAELLFTEMNTEYYNSLSKRGLDVKLKLEKVVFLDTNIVTTDNNEGKKANSETSMFQFHQYMLDNKLYSKDFDLAMLFTGLELYNGFAGKGAFGSSFLGTVCKNVYNVGVVEILGSSLDGVEVSHEISHILGAIHDEQCRRDQWEKGNTMNSLTYKNSDKRFEFSDCSYDSIKKVLDKLDTSNTNCLVDSTIEEKVLKGLTADERCKTLYGRFWSVDRGAYASKGYDDLICQKLVCIERNGKQFKRQKVSGLSDGIICGKSKKCHGDACSAGRGADNVDDSCPLGDQDMKLWNYKPCDQSACKANGWKKKYCCATCQ